jgi:hypothetical protein
MIAWVLAATLLANGDFSKADPQDARRPWHWVLPDGLGVQWTEGAIRMDTRVSEQRMNDQWTKMGLTNTWFIPNAAGNPIAETYGLSFYSDAVPVQTGQAYRVSFDFKGPGGGKVWVRCYDGERRIYEKVVFCEQKAEHWKRYREVFFPTRYRPKCQTMRVMLYAYYPPGIYWFDNVAIEPITTAEYDREKAAAESR